jgi:putative ABC transport system permease protein
MFARPEIDLQVALTALFVLVIGGIIAGLIPAQKAASVNPIEALRTE